MPASAFCENFIKTFETLALKAYRCPAGVPTIGWGHTSAAGAPSVTMGMVITEQTAAAIFDSDIQTFAVGVSKALGSSAFSQCEFDACVSLAFNIGMPNFLKSSVLRLLKQGDKPGAADAILLWNRATVGGKKVVEAGLVRRRKGERALFLGDFAGASRFAEANLGPIPQAVVAPEQREKIQQSQTAQAAGGITVGGAVVAYQGAKDALQNASDIKDTATQAAGLFGSGGLLLGVGVLLVAAAGYIIWRRYLRSKSELVTPGEEVDLQAEAIDADQPEAALAAPLLVPTAVTGLAMPIDPGAPAVIADPVAVAAAATIIPADNIAAIQLQAAIAAQAAAAPVEPGP